MKIKKMYVVNKDGSFTKNPKDKPAMEDMVVIFTDGDTIQIEAPGTGSYSTKKQRDTVASFVGDWLEDHTSETGKGTVDIKVTKLDNGINAAIIGITGGDKITAKEATEAAGLIGKWVGETAEPAKKPDGTTRTAPKDDKPDDTKGSKPDGAKDGKPDDTRGHKPDDAPDDKKGHKPDDTTKSTPKGDDTSKKGGGIHWDPNLSVDENIDRIWNS